MKEGDLLVNKELAKTMRTIRDDPEDFYVGKLAERIVQDINAEGGIKAGLHLRALRSHFFSNASMLFYW